MPILSVFAFLENLSSGEKGLLIIAVTVAVVTGMWVGLYKRGKK